MIFQLIVAAVVVAALIVMYYAIEFCLAIKSLGEFLD